MNTAPPSVESVFARAWQLLTGNWIIILPPIVIGLIVGVVDGFLAPTADAGDPANTAARSFGVILSSMLIAGVGILGSIANQAYVTGMAGAAWMRGRTTLADGTASFREDAGRIVTAAIGLILAGILAVVLIPFTLGLSLFAYIFFTIYTMPAAIVGNVPGFRALQESFQIATRRFGTTLIVLVLIFVITLAGSLVSHLLALAPLLGPVVAAVLVQAMQAYVTLVIVGEYINLRSAEGVPVPPPPVV